MFDRFLIWFDDRTVIPTYFHQIRNVSVPNNARCGRLLAAMVLFTFLLQILSGIMLGMFFCPSAQTAWESLFYLQFHLSGGWLIRGIHHFSGQLLPLWLGLYLLWQVFSGRYRAPYEFVFWSAFILFLFSLGSLFTGSLLSWTSSAYTATLIQTRFLQMLPYVGDPLFRIVCGGTEIGTLTLLRFLVFHIMFFGTGFFVLALLWRYFDHRAAHLNVGINVTKKNQANEKQMPFFSNEILKYSLASLFVAIVVLLCIFRLPILHLLRPDFFAMNNNLPREAALGAPLGVPAEPGGFYKTARPEWIFRGWDRLSNLKIKGDNGTEQILFSGDKKYIPIFIVPGCIILYIWFIPLIGRLFMGHCLNVFVVGVLFVSLGYLTYDSYRFDYFAPSMQTFRDYETAAVRQANRAIELCLTTEIPATGVRTLMQDDPFLQGPILFKQHCSACHAFEPLEGEAAYADYEPIPSGSSSAPNLYHPIRKEWILGFLDPKKIRGADYFGNTKFASGTMSNFVNGGLQKIAADFENREKFDQELDQLVTFLVSEAKREGVRTSAEPVSEEQYQRFAVLGCSDCHATFHPTKKPAIQAPDLRGYLSRNWLVNMIADPETTLFYGPVTKNNQGNVAAMPAFYRSADTAVLSITEIEMLADWLHGSWHRYQKVSVIEEAMLPIQAESESIGSFRK